MAEIIDILTNGIASSQYIIVDSSGAFSFVGGIYAPAATATVYNASNAFRLKRGDSFSILSAGFILPEGFTQWRDRGDVLSPLAQYSILLKGVSSGRIFDIDVLGMNRVLFMPLENYEIAVDIFCDVPKQKTILAPIIPLDEDFSIEAFISPLYISMAGAPSALHGKHLIINSFLKILHNFPMY